MHKVAKLLLPKFLVKNRIVYTEGGSAGDGILNVSLVLIVCFCSTKAHLLEEGAKISIILYDHIQVSHRHIFAFVLFKLVTAAWLCCRFST